MDYYYQQQSPLLTKEKENEIHKLYQLSYSNSNSNSSNSSNNNNNDDSNNINNNINNNNNNINNNNNNDDEWESKYLISLQNAYMIIFNSEERVDYTYSLFLEDMKNFTRSHEDALTFNEAIAFLQIMQ